MGPWVRSGSRTVDDGNSPIFLLGRQPHLCLCPLRPLFSTFSISRLPFSSLHIITYFIHEREREREIFIFMLSPQHAVGWLISKENIDDEYSACRFLSIRIIRLRNMASLNRTRLMHDEVVG